MPAMGAAAGPDKRVLAASSVTASGDVTPPLDCIISKIPLKRSSLSFSVSLKRYFLRMGPTAELRTVVLTRL